MKFPSIAVLSQGLLKTLRRWPLSILLATVASVLLMRAFHFYPGNRERLWVTIFSCYEGMLLTIAATILSETREWKVGGKVLIQGLALGLALLFYWWLPVQDVRRAISVLVVTLSLHWLIAFLPYVAPRDSMLGFWDYNRKLFLRALQTLLYTLVLYAGIALALLAIEHLFGVSFEYAYANTWWTLAGIFNPIFFLAAFPKEYARPERIVDYPKGLKVFTQYVLLPIVTVYLAILYAYLFKIVLTAHWPSGWVAYLVLGFSVAGILALLLIWPLRDEEGNRWIRSYSRFFYLALIPLIVLLWVAIWKRSHSYGITEQRYYVLLLAAWLSGIAGYFVFSARKDIRLIPASLCVLALLSLWGPWSARSLSLDSQMGRLKTLLEKDGLFADGRIVASERPLPLEDRKQISSIVEYITSMHDYRVLQPWFRVKLDSVMNSRQAIYSDDHWNETRVLVSLMGFDYVNQYEMEDAALNNFYRLREDHPVIRTGDVEFIVPDISVGERQAYDSGWVYYPAGNDSIRMRIDTARHLLQIAMRGGGTASDIDLRPLEKAITDPSTPAIGGMSQSAMTLENGYYRIIVTTANGVHKDRSMHIMHVQGYLMKLAGKKE